MTRLSSSPDLSGRPAWRSASHSGSDAERWQLASAGFDDITLRRYDARLQFGEDLYRAVEVNLALGPAAEALRLAGEQGEEIRPELEKLVRGALSRFVQPDGEVRAQPSTWIVGACA